MKRYAAVALVMVLSVALVGCEEKKTAGEPPIKLGLAPGETAPYNPTGPSTGEITPPTGTEVTRGGGNTTTVETPGAADGLRGPYTVQKGDTLMGLARKHYGEVAKWKDIWNANRNKIPDPNVLKAGIQITLP